MGNKTEDYKTRLKTLEEKALALEEKAGFAEKEAIQRKRIAKAKSRISATKQRAIHLPHLPHIPSGFPRFLIGVGILVAIILIVAKAC